jgi:hypothetical protein
MLDNYMLHSFSLRENNDLISKNENPKDNKTQFFNISEYDFLLSHIFLGNEIFHYNSYPENTYNHLNRTNTNLPEKPFE